MTVELRDEVIVLGCGPSIAELTDADRQYINSCKYRIAINKFTAFHELAGIRPTHVFFIDSYDDSCKNWLQYTFAVAIADKLDELTFVVSKEIERPFRYCTSEDQRILSENGYFQELRKSPFGWSGVLGDEEATFLVPERCNIDFVTHVDWLLGGKWAGSLDEPLFHYRGGLTSLLNYVSICFPGKKVRLVGTDFYSGTPFFELELQGIGFCWQDWTTPIAKQHDKHYSAIQHDGATMFDRFALVLEYMLRSSNPVSCVQANSLLVKEGYVPFLPFYETTLVHPADAADPTALWDAHVKHLELLFCREQELARRRTGELAIVQQLKASWSWRIGHLLTSLLSKFLPSKSNG